MVIHKDILEQFNRLLESPSGACWRAVDLHIHTPASRDYRIGGQPYERVSVDDCIALAMKEGLVTKEMVDALPEKPEKDSVVADLIVHKAVQQGLSIVAVTDHNIISNDWLATIRRAYEEYRKRTRCAPLCILPGIEITAYGGNHVIGIFDFDNITNVWQELKYKLNFDEEVVGKDGPICTKSELDIIQVIANLGGITYIPHIDNQQVKLKDMLGSLSGKSKIKLLKDPSLHALGFSNYQHHMEVKTHLEDPQDPYYRSLPIAYIRDSDAHDPVEIGTNPIYVKLDSLSFQSLKFALEDPELRIHSHDRKHNEVTIIGMAIKGGWFRNEGASDEWQYVRFSEDLNTIIGGRGTGKSTIIKLLNASITLSTSSPGDRDFLATFNVVLTFVAFQHELYCIVFEPCVQIDSYTNEPIYPHGPKSSITKVDNWVRVYRIDQHAKTLKALSIPERNKFLEEIQGEKFEQTEILRLATNPEAFDQFFNRIVCMCNPGQGYEESLRKRQDIKKDLKGVGWRITNSFALDEINNVMSSYRSLNTKIRALRESTIAKINAEMKGILEVRLIPVDIEDDYYNLLQSAVQPLENESIKSNDPWVEDVLSRIVKNIRPWELVRLLRAGEYNTIIKRAQLPEKEKETFKDVEEKTLSVMEFLTRLRTEVLKRIAPDLLSLVEDDQVALFFNVNYNTNRQPVMKPISQLSLGQKAVAILTLITKGTLGRNGKPLIIDQPEDHLDNLYIYSNLVSSLRLLKGHRQLIIVTHNPNLVVASDAEQVICLDSDNTRGWISAVGSIDRDKIQEFVLRCLEGGKEALVMRLKKYRISLEQQ